MTPAMDYVARKGLEWGKRAIADLTEPRQHRSVSQYNLYARCPMAYKLSRIDGCWQRPAAWLAQGSAVHTVYEIYELRKLEGDPMSLEDARELFAEEYAKEVARYTDQTPNLEYWFRSGPYGGEADLERRFAIGMDQVKRIFDWDAAHPEEVIWIAEDGTPGIELAFDIDLDGVLVRGYIDAVIRYNDTGLAVVRDYKTGNKPGDDFQLGVYSVALAEQYGVSAPAGDYWMGKTGKPTYPYDLTEWTRERVSEKFRELEDNIAAGRFDPKPDPDVCKFCDVALSCEYSQA